MVEIAGQEVRINTDHRTGILLEEVLADDSLDDVEKLQTALALYYPGMIFAPEEREEAVARLLWFYRCGEEPKKPNEADDADEGGAPEEPPYSYEHDADYIYAGFMEAYGLDLARTTLHWWQFRALFKALPESTQFMKIIGYRVFKIPAKMPKEEKQFYTKMKKLYALPQKAERQQLESDLTAILLNGGNPSALL